MTAIDPLVMKEIRERHDPDQDALCESCNLLGHIEYLEAELRSVNEFLTWVYAELTGIQKALAPDG